MADNEFDQLLDDVKPKANDNGVLKHIKRKVMNYIVWPSVITTAVVTGANIYLYMKNPDNYIDYAKHVGGDWLKENFPSLYDEKTYIYPNVPLEQASLNSVPVPAYIDRRIDYASTYKALEKDMMRLIAAQESSFKATIKNEFSEACGLMQLLPSTQLELMYKYGNEYGYDSLTRYIKNDKGEKVVENPNTRETVLNICTDAMFSVEMGAEYARENIVRLHSDFPGRYVSYTDVYMYHFLGGNGGRKFIENLEATPDRAVAQDYPARVVKANKPTFYKDGGKGAARSYAEIYEFYANKISTEVISTDKARHEEHYSFRSFIDRAFPSP